MFNAGTVEEDTLTGEDVNIQPEQKPNQRHAKKTDNHNQEKGIK